MRWWKGRLDTVRIEHGVGKGRSVTSVGGGRYAVTGITPMAVIYLYISSG
jgi:hypothetical protein